MKSSQLTDLDYESIVLENVSDIVVTTDLDFNVEFWNKAAEEYYGISFSRAKGKKMSELVQFNYLDDSLEVLIDQLKTKGHWSGELSFVSPGGEVKFVLYSVKRFYNREGIHIGYLSNGRDIADRKKAEDDLLASEQFYRALIGDSLDAIILADKQGKMRFATPAIKTVLGFDPEEVIGDTVFNYVHPDDASWAVQSFQREVMEDPIIKFIHVRLKKKSGEWIWCMVRGHNLLKNPYVSSIAVYFHDDSLRKRANDALKESEKKFKEMIRGVQIGIMMQDKDANTILCNKALTSMFGVEEDDLIGKRMDDVVIDPIRENGRKYKMEERPCHRAIQTKKPVKDVMMGIMIPGHTERTWLLVNADPILDDAGEIVHIVTSIKDITERKKMTDAFIAEKINHQRQLTQATIDGQERERLEIGKELHDNIGQQLTTVKLYLDLARTTADEATRRMLEPALKGVLTMINDIRNIARSLVPSTLKDLGLIDSINELIEFMAYAHPIKFVFEYDESVDKAMAENQKIALFRILQEQLNNVAKYAKATTVHILLFKHEHTASLSVVDDGSGFDLSATKKGLGLVNIRNRAELLGGKAEIHSSPGKGCTLKVSIPLPVHNLN